jgi:hypothetical protein
MAELRMVGLALTGRMRREVERLDAHRDQG